jgi:tetratricopeptide (TPR) repeat protein
MLSMSIAFYNRFISNATYVFLLIFLISCTSTNTRDTGDINSAIKKARNNQGAIDTAYVKQTARVHVVNGSVYEQEQKYAEAIIEYQQALRYDSSAAIYFTLAKCYHLLEYYDLSQENVLTCLEKDSSFVPAMELLADLFIMRYQLDNAIQTYEKIIKLDNSRQYRINLARLYELRDVDKAIILYYELLRDNDDINILIRLAKLLEQQGRNDESLAIQEKLFNIRPNAESALVIIESRFKTQNYDDAFRILFEASDILPPEDLTYTYGRVTNYLMNDSSTSLKQYMPGFLDKLNSKYYFEWRIILMGAFLADKQGEKEYSDKFFKRTLNLADSIPDIPIQIGLHYLQIRDYNRSIEIFKKYEAYYPKDSRFPLFIGMVLGDQNRLSESLNYLNKAVALDSSNFDTWAQIGLTYDRLGIPDSSDKAYLNALKIDSTDPLVNNNYAYSMSVRGINLEKAEKMSRMAINADPNNAAYLDTYGWIQYQLGNYGFALEYVLKATKSPEPSAEVFEHLGDIYIRLNKVEEAISALEKSLNIEPGRESVRIKIESLKKGMD